MFRWQWKCCDNILQIKFIDSARFIASSLSNLVDDLAEGIHKIICKDCGCFFEYEIVDENSISYIYLSCNKSYSKKLIKVWKIYFKIHLSFLMISIKLFCC